MKDIETLLQEYEPYITMLAKYYRVNGYEVDDLKQEFRIKLIKCNENFDETRGSFKTYFANTCANHIKNLYRSNDRSVKVTYMNENDIDKKFEDKDVEDSSYILDLLHTLPDGVITEMCVLDEMSQSEVAERLGISTATVSRKNKRNLEILKDIYENGV